MSLTNWNKMAQAALLVLMSLVLVNCAEQDMEASASSIAEELTSKSNPPHPPVPKFGTVSISYRSWGGFPGPNGPLYTNLDLVVQADGKVSAKLETASCASKMNISKAEFEELVAMVNNSPYNIGRGFAGADIGIRTIALQSTKPNDPLAKPSHLIEDETSKGEKVLVDGVKISAKINGLVTRLSAACKATCLPQ